MACAALLASSQASGATALNIDFGPIQITPPAGYGAGADQPGAWNAVGALGTFQLLDLNGDPLPGVELGLVAEAAVVSSGGSATAVQRLVNDGFFSGELDPWVVTISGLDDGLYDVYYYAPSSTSVATGLFTVNGMVAADIPNDQFDTTALVFGVNYGIVAGVPVSEGVMTFLAGPSAFDTLTGLAGIQLVPIAIPVPAVWLLLSGIAALGLYPGRRPRSS